MTDENGLWMTGWVGDTNSCNEIDLDKLQSNITTIFQINETGDYFISENLKDGLTEFSVIKKLNCGEGYIIHSKHEIEDKNLKKSGNNNLVIPNFPLDFTLYGLNSEYINGNGRYEITSKFENKFPTYLGENGWTVYKRFGYWWLSSNKIGLGKLKNSSYIATIGSFVLDGCTGSNCQTASAQNISQTPSPSVLTNATPTPTQTKIINSEYPPPILEEISSPTNNKVLKYRWNTSTSVLYCKYKFNNYRWISVDIKEISLNANEGENIFLVKAVYTDGTESEESISKVVVDTTSPQKPEILSINKIADSSSTILVSVDMKDANFIKHRINENDWNLIEIFTEKQNIKMECIHGDNSVSIYGIDKAGNESELLRTFIYMDLKSPTPPVIEDVESPNNEESIEFKWNYTESDIEIAEYKLDLLGETNESSGWVISDELKRKKINFEKDGIYKFSVRLIDYHGNVSQPSDIEFEIDATPPTTPIIKSVEIVEVNSEKKLKYNIIKDNHSLSRTFYRSNIDVNWTELRTNELILQTNEGENYLTVYSKDSVGNETQKITKTTFVSQSIPEPPVIYEPQGLCPNTLWKKIYESCQMDIVGFKTNVEITYSYIKEDTLLGNDQDLYTSNKGGVYSKKFGVRNINADILKSEVRNSFHDWKTIIESAFPNVSITFKEIGVETDEQQKIPSSPNVFVSDSTLLPDIRIGCYAESTGLDYYEYPLDRSFQDEFSIKTGSSDIHLNTSLNWTTKDNPGDSEYNIRHGLKYLIGKSLGLSHGESVNGTMNSFSAGITHRGKIIDDIKHFKKLYSNLSISVDKKVIIKSDNFKFKWRVATDISYEWRYLVIDKNRKILKTNTGNITTNENFAFVEIDVNQFPNEFEKIKFYVRAINKSGNLSEYSILDVFYEKTPTQILVNDIIGVCKETRTTYRCWDENGKFSYIIKLNSKSNNILLSMRNLNNQYGRLLEFKTDSTNVTIKDLASESDYQVKFYNRREIKNEEDFENFNTLNLYKKTPKYEMIKTDKSISTNPGTIELKSIEHYVSSNSNKIEPIGEYYTKDGWKPTANVNWTIKNPSHVKLFRIIYSRLMSFNEKKIVEIKNKNINKFNLSLDEYDVRYYVKIEVEDEYGNISTSNIKKYNTIVLNEAPNLEKELSIDYGYEFTKKYNERPGYKWTLRFSLPWASDSQYPSTSKIPDTDIPSRTDYTITDWYSLIGHLPLKLECSQWPNSDVKEYWVFKNFISDSNGETVTNFPISYYENQFHLDIHGFEANKEYTFKYTIYDSSGKYIQNTKTIKTNNYSGDIYGPPPPTLGAKLDKYYSGHSLTGKSLKEYKWGIEFKITMTAIKDLSKFFIFRKNLSKNKQDILKVTKSEFKKYQVGSQVTYSIILGGHDSMTKYSFKVDAVDSSENRSKISNEVTLVTGNGDDSVPPKVSLSNLRSIIMGNESKLMWKINKPSQTGNTFFIFYTKNVGEDNMWTFENKSAIEGEIKYNRYYEISDKNVDLNEKHKFIFMWRSSSFVWSEPLVVFVEKNRVDMSYSSLNHINSNNSIRVRKSLQKDNLLDFAFM